MNRQRYLEVWTPLRWIQIRFFVTDEGDWWIKVGHHSRVEISLVILIQAVARRWLWHGNSKDRRH